MTSQLFFNSESDRVERMTRRQARAFFWAFCTGLVASILAGSLMREALVQWTFGWRQAASFVVSCISATLIAAVIYLLLWQNVQRGHDSGPGGPVNTPVDGGRMVRALMVLFVTLIGMIALLAALGALFWQSSEIR